MSLRGPARNRWAPQWLVNLVGLDYFVHVVTVNLPHEATDAEIVHVARLARLHKLNLAGSSVSDAGLAHLKGLTELSYLNLGGTQVTDAGVRELQRALPMLKIWR